ncbi:hypothetical protein AVEN_82380-1 [Araneus ventricosus]|uniref:Uncharacterized protein n=1 Tax=Araneus ventricosus TaxID=182803 RepID=A0A4Y2HIN4_ARAVE|nr:hypothetical protein AVEN_82380-1 [Araneus ventricosus]
MLPTTSSSCNGWMLSTILSASFRSPSPPPTSKMEVNLPPIGNVPPIAVWQPRQNKCIRAFVVLSPLPHCEVSGLCPRLCTGQIVHLNASITLASYSSLTQSRAQLSHVCI